MQTTCMTKKTVLITGTSTGIGWACSMELDRQGWQVYAAVRKEADGQKLSDATSGRIKPVIMDITDYDSVKAAATKLSTELGGRGLDALINNAGITIQGPMELIPMDMFEWQVKVNVHGHVAVTQSFLPLVRKNKGRILFMSSVSGRMTMPLVGPYSTSKFGIEAAANAFRIELLSQGIKVSLIEPGSIKTPIWEKSNDITERIVAATSPELKEVYKYELKTTASAPDMFHALAIPVEKVVNKVMHAVSAKRPKPRYIVGFDAWFYILNYTYAPTFLWDWCNNTIIRLLGRFV